MKAAHPCRMFVSSLVGGGHPANHRLSLHPPVVMAAGKSSWIQASHLLVAGM